MITKLKAAWMYLGLLFESFELTDVPHDLLFEHGICNELDFCSPNGNRSWGEGGKLAEWLEKRIAPEILDKMREQMESTMQLQDFLQQLDNFDGVCEDGNMLGKAGNDYNTRANWCYLMAEVGELPKFIHDDYSGDPQVTSLQDKWNNPEPKSLW